MLVRDAMVLTVGAVSPSDRLREAAEKMKSGGVDPMPVCDGDRLIGMLTDRDVQTAAADRGLAAGMAPVSEVMTQEVVYCFDDQDLSEAAAILERHSDHGHQGILVVNREKKLVGVVPLSAFSARDTSFSETRDPEGDQPYEDIDRDPVDHMSEESFPASDPPSPPVSLGPTEDEPA